MNLLFFRIFCEIYLKCRFHVFLPSCHESLKDYGVYILHKKLSISYIYIYFFFFNLFLFGCIGSLLLCAGFLQLRRAGATLPCGAQASHCGGFSCCGAWALGMRASVVVAHRLSCSLACEIFPDQGLNLCPLHWQVNS